MNYVFGPVSSKRLGQSLGVDLLPSKSCTWNCVYCQLGRTKEYVTERREFFPKEDILAEILDAVSSGKKIDWITFVGSGETTLYKGLDWLIAEVKKATEIPVAVITNGSLLCLPEVRKELLEADAVLPSLNAGSAELFERIDRPASGFTFEKHVEGLRLLRQEYRGKLWVEVMLIRGLNDSEAALNDMAAVLAEIRPDMIHLVLPTRPAPESMVGIPDEELVQRAVFILSAAAPVLHPAKGEMNLGSAENLLDTVAAIASRHPVQERELETALGKLFDGDAAKIREALDSLFASGRFDKVRQGEELYWIVKTA
ncbi:radical SAM protein [Chlorobaculum thiosulfatiphilum]|uniref:Radical SAM protein n=1 Tax=Chlorobaculum thiosulfatiphilum TaxID=115852 RepID=A0A5C4S6P5_CHLTI|nr:radical SAM protein [Chlorobaculum thiosulfatiphilum]TNJ38391.1 radical SAM protein [Chlorobaculum thiosulfatiphilum]